MPGELNGQIAIITGASRGIGAEIARTFSREGAAGLVLVSSGNNKEQAENVAHDVNASGAKVVVVYQDLSDPAAAEAVVAQAKSEFGHIDSLVNNAGVTRDNDLLRMTVDDWDTVMNTNLRPAYLLSQQAVKQRIFPKDGDKSITQVSSVVGVVGNSGQENYGAAKAGLINLTSSLARNLGRRNVRVNAVAPGFIDTDMTQAMNPTYKEDILAAVTQLTPMGRLGTVRDVAEAVSFLSSRRASFITGQVLSIDGGLGGSLHAVPALMGSIRNERRLRTPNSPS